MRPDKVTPDEPYRSEKIGNTQPIGGEGSKTASGNFGNLMNQAGSSNPLAKSTGSVSPMEMMQQNQRVLAAGPTPASLLQQTKTVQSALGDVQTQLNTPNLKLKQSQKYLLKNKLSEASAHLRSANSSLGLPTLDEPETDDAAGPIDKFLNFLTDGQRQVELAQRHLKEITANGKQISPGQMLLVQIRLSKAQQEIEFSSVLLSKAVEDTKMLFNIQL